MARHITNLNIGTFRGINDLELKNLGDINILVGENNSGKTTVLEVIKGLSVPLEIGNWLSACRKRDNILGSMSNYTALENMFNINNEDKIVKVTVDISEEKFQVEIHGSEEVVLMAKSEIEEMSYVQRTGRINRNAQSSLDDVKFRKQEEIKLINVQLKLNGGDLSENLANEKIYEVTRRVRVSEKESIRLFIATYIAPFEHTFNSFYLKEVLEDSELYADLIKIAQIFDQNIVGINSFTENMDQVFKITSASNSKALPLAVYGDGIKKALLLISAIIKSKNGVLLLDELETAIHASVLNEIFSLVLETCKKFNVQLFATTHSLEAVDKILQDAENSDILQNMRVITLVKKEKQTIARILEGEKAMQVRDDYDMELRK